MAQFHETEHSEQASNPATPASGKRRIYAKTDGWYDQDDAGVVTQIGSVVGSLAIDGKLNIAIGSELTIATGAITITKSVHSVDTESDAASDDLDTILGGATGDYVTIYPDDGARTVVIKNGTGNIACGADITLDETYKVVTLQYDGANWQLRAVTVSTAAGGAMDDFTLAADSGTPETVADGNTLTIAGGTGIVTSVAATDTVTVAVDINSLSADASPDGAADYVMTRDATDGSTKKVLLNNLPGGGGGGGVWDIYLRDEKTSGTAGGTSSSTTTHTRVLNTEVYDPLGFCTLSANQFTLLAGTYDIQARAPGYITTRQKARLYNVTDTAYELEGASSNNADDVGDAWLQGRFTIAGSKAFELRHYIQTGKATDGLGRAVSVGVEVYAEVLLKKVA